METQTIESFSKLLQMSMLPVVLISGVGLLLLSVSNRLGRTVDRARSLAHELESAQGPYTEGAKAQVRILVRRSELLRTSVSFIAASILCSSLMIVGLFLLIFAGAPAQIFILGCFLASVFGLIVSIVFFLLDISLSLKALRLDLEPHIS